MGAICVVPARFGGGLVAVQARKPFKLLGVSTVCGKYPPAKPGALGIGPLEAATLDPKLYLFGRRTKYSLPTSPRPFIQIFLRHFGEQMPLDNCVATWCG